MIQDDDRNIYGSKNIRNIHNDNSDNLLNSNTITDFFLRGRRRRRLHQQRPAGGGHGEEHEVGQTAVGEQQRLVVSIKSNGDKIGSNNRTLYTMNVDNSDSGGHGDVVNNDLDGVFTVHDNDGDDNHDDQSDDFFDTHHQYGSATRSDQRATAARRTMINFVWMSVLFSANHGCVVSCLGLASARLGSVGAWQSGILYFTYTASALLGATYIVKRTGARNALFIGMVLYCAYVACFWIATVHSTDPNLERFAAYTGAAIGGVGAGFLWTAQGAYFGLAAEDHAQKLEQPVSASTASLAGIFAFFYLSEEVALRLLSTALLQSEVASWGTIFATYTIIAMLSTSLVPFLHNYSSSDRSSSSVSAREVDGVNSRAIENPDDTTTSILQADDGAQIPSSSQSLSSSRPSNTLRLKADAFYKVTAAAQLLVRDSKMKYMVGLNAAFGFASAFMNSYVNGQVVPVALDDPESKYIGILGSWVPTVAAGMSLLFGQIAPQVGKGPILILGATCFGCVALPFAIQPDATKYTWSALILIYTLHGTGRATFESTLKALFADYFPFEKEGAFANIIFQNGLAGSLGYILTFSLHCGSPARYCIKYNDGSLHDVLTFVLVVLVSAGFAIVGYIRASTIYAQEQRRTSQQEGDSTILLGRNRDGVSA